MLCETKFSLLGDHQIRHCKRCAKAICKVCSEASRQLSVKDKELHRVCDECDTEMDNFTIKAKYEEVCLQQEQKIESMQQQIIEQDQKKVEIENDFEDLMQELDAELDKKIKRKQEIEDKLRELTYKVTDMNASH